MQQLDVENRPATVDERQVLARWSSWGAIPQVFDDALPGWSTEYAELRSLFDDAAYGAARRTTINAHYTAPEITREMWSALEQLGFDGGVVLEPGCGSGTFIGTAPDGASMIGVELDPTTARIAARLYPDADIRAESFAHTRVPGGVDAVVGNVPFGDIRLHDPLHNAGNHSIHNHFIIKSLHLTRPGGLVAVLTSRYTLDATNPAARREMQALGDLVGAVRLPSGAHQRSAGTEAVTDVLVFRRRAAGQEPAPFDWELTTAVDVDQTQVRISRYFAERPGQVLGQLGLDHGMYGADTLVVRTDDQARTPERLKDALSAVVARGQERGLTFTPVSAELAAERVAEVERSTQLWDGTIVDAGAEVGFQIVEAGQLTELAVPKTRHAELRALLGLRDQAQALLSAEATTREDTPELDQQRAELRNLYEGYVERFGPLNRFTLRPTGRDKPVADPFTGEPLVDADGQVVTEPGMARITPPVMTVLRKDPHGPVVMALEVFDDVEQTARPASLLIQRVVAPRPFPQGADNPAEAVALSMDRVGRIDLPLVAGLLGVDETEARTQLGTLVYDDPATGTIMPAPEYLSGDVRVRLDQAEAAARQDARFEVNVDALRKVQPEPIGIDEIQARLGSVWISPQIHREFLSEILHDPSVQVQNPLPGRWEIRGRRYGILATSEWGTPVMAATQIAEHAMNQSRIEVKDRIEGPDGRPIEVINPIETAAAQAKAEALQERFADWVWEDPARAAQLAEVYNRRFNSIVLRDYSAAGEHLTTPGLAETIQLRPHQRAAVARMIAEPAVGLFHSVGAGKTLEMVVGATELKRMGLINKPCIAVPNHMLEQFSREWLQAYPQARVLAASSDDLGKDQRRLFVARAATNDWDAIILTHGALKKIGVSPQAEADYINRQLDELRSSRDAAREAGSTSVKTIEKAVARLEGDLRKKLDTPRDEGVNWEDTGIDYLIVDEAHTFKNLSTPSNIRDAAIEGSAQASDLHMKLEFLRSQHGDRVATLATATPLANSITEAYVMQRYLRPDLMEAAGVTSFDGWAATFGEVVTEMEMAPAGGFRLKDRFAKFTNVPEMLRMWHVFADVKMPDDLKLPVPAIAPRASDGRREPEIVVLDPTPELSDYIAELSDRAELVASRAVPAYEDNMLLISGDGRKAALDMRLVDAEALPTGPVKLDAVAHQILKTWNATRANEYLDPTGQPSELRGGLQLVFCDLGTPNPDRWNAYSELKRILVNEGMDSASIRFIHEAKTDREKASLFAAARSGHISVLIGSTGKMGVGTNVQDRITAMHHVDCPWRPADLEQRDGRGVRQGNQNSEVAIYRYVVEGSFDSYSWQTVARKARFIAQVMRGKLDSREIEDVGDTALSAAEVKALASGNPLLLDKANADTKLQSLRRQETAHKRAQAALVYTQQTALERRTTIGNTIDALTAAEQRTIPTAGDAFRMQIGRSTYASRADAAKGLALWALDNPSALYSHRSSRPTPVGTIGGHTLTAHAEQVVRADWTRETVVKLQLDGVPMSTSTIKPDELADAGVGTIRTIENKAAAITKNIATLRTELHDNQRVLDDATARIGQPFKKAAELDRAAADVESIDAKLALLARRTEPPQPTSTLTDAAGRPKNAPEQSTWRASFPNAPGQKGQRPAETSARPHTPRSVRKSPSVDR